MKYRYIMKVLETGEEVGTSLLAIQETMTQLDHKYVEELLHNGEKITGIALEFWAEKDVLINECVEHVIDKDSLSIVTESIKLDVDDDQKLHFIIDVSCKKCGCSGSFRVCKWEDDINW